MVWSASSRSSRPGESFQYTSGCVLDDAARHDARQLSRLARRRLPLRRHDRAVLAGVADRRAATALNYRAYIRVAPP